VGYFNPLIPKSKPERISLDSERIKHWLKIGAQPTFRVARFLGEAKLAPIPEKRNNPQKALPRKKTQERLKAQQASEQKKEDKVEAAPTAETPKEQPAKAPEVAKPAEEKKA